MDDRDGAVALEEPSVAGELSPEQEEIIAEKSVEYLGRWNRLISTTNWEKGRIIVQWRESLAEAGLPATMITDEAFARQASRVTPQHVGRLRRVYQQFGDSYEQYAGLFWSHFHAALDWPDAPQWLKTASRKGLSVAKMREQRCEALGILLEKKGREDELLDDAEDEAGDELSATGGELAEVRDYSQSERDEAEEESDEGVPFNFDGLTGEDQESEESESAEPVAQAREAAPSPVRPFEKLPKLPADLTEAMELFKLAILAHKLVGWTEIQPADVLSALDALKQLVTAPPGDQ